MTPPPPRSFSPGRKWNITLNTALLVLSVVALLVMVNYLASRHYARFAWVDSAPADLSPLTRKVLASVTNEVRAVLYFDRREPLFEMSHALLRSYATVNPRIRVETIDYSRDASAAEAAKRKYNLGEKNDRDLVIFESQGRTKKVYQGELSDLDLRELMSGRSGEVKRTAFKGEMHFTSAILTVLTPRQLKAYFLQGHGEHSPESDDVLAGYSKLAGVLTENGVRFEKLQVAGDAEIPTDCNLLIIAGPRTRLPDSTLAKIGRYLNQGGRLLALFTSATATRSTGLEALLADWGVAVGGNIVLDEDHSESLTKHDMVISRFGTHKLVRPLVGAGLYLVLPRAITRDKEAPRGSDAPKVELLAYTSPGGRVIEEIDRNGGYDRTKYVFTGEVPLMVAVERGGVRDVSAARGSTRIVVTGDSIFLANGSIDKLANHEFASHAINWLLARDELLVPIPPRPIQEYKLTVSRAQMKSVLWILLVGMPAAPLLLGTLVWLRRRR